MVLSESEIKKYMSDAMGEDFDKETYERILSNLSEEPDKRPYRFLILYELTTARDLAECLKKALEPYGRSFPIPLDDISSLPNADIIDLISKTEKELHLNYLSDAFDIFPRKTGLTKLEEEIERAKNQSQIVIPIVTLNFFTCRKSLDLLKNSKDKEIIYCIYKDTLEKLLRKDCTKLFEKNNIIRFSSSYDLNSKVIEYISNL